MIRLLGEYVLRGLDRLLVLITPVAIDNNRIVLIRLDNIGDFVLWLDAARQLRNYYQDMKITLIANQGFSELAMALPYWDDVIPVDVRKSTRNIVYRWRLLCHIRKLGALRVIHPVFSRVFLVGDAIVRASGAGSRIGSVGDLNNCSARQRRVANRWYTTLLPATSSPIPEMERTAEFMSGLTGYTTHVGVGYIPPLAQLTPVVDSDDEYFVLFPGASWVGRMWPAENFARCANWLYEKYGLKAIICGGPSEEWLGEIIVSGVSTHRVTDLTGRTTLVDLIEVLRGAKFLISNETSAVHLASSVGTPAVCILGGGHYGRFLPYPDGVNGCKPNPVIHRMDCFGCDWTCRHDYDAAGPVPCIAGIRVDDVIESVVGLVGVE